MPKITQDKSAIHNNLTENTNQVPLSRFDFS